MPTPTKNAEGWTEWSKHVLTELERLNENCARLDDRINESYAKLDDKINEMRRIQSEISGGLRCGEHTQKLDKYYERLVKLRIEHSDKLASQNDVISAIREELAALKVKAGIWGAIGAAIPVLMWIIFNGLCK